MAHSTSPDDEVVDFAFQCPRVSCRRMFVAEYGLEAGNTFEPADRGRAGLRRGACVLLNGFVSRGDEFSLTGQAGVSR